VFKSLSVCISRQLSTGTHGACIYACAVEQCLSSSNIEGHVTHRARKPTILERSHRRCMHTHDDIPNHSSHAARSISQLHRQGTFRSATSVQCNGLALRSNNTTNLAKCQAAHPAGSAGCGHLQAPSTAHSLSPCRLACTQGTQAKACTGDARMHM
jgi:hypothetical protein